jgi:hypothetical protein
MHRSLVYQKKTIDQLCLWVGGYFLVGLIGLWIGIHVTCKLSVSKFALIDFASVFL